ncbi:MAG: elongation factor G [Candidatus Omnitrophica bacterium]|nr:elongation factor G [Candidatus Omnitrophota bacterium]MDD5137762.1 elongation factor G [Candidatus Omnitrophota bacterium]
MDNVKPDAKRTVVFVSHAQAGKTTLVEALLFAAGAISRKGSVAEGNTTSDYNPDEIQRKNSINSSLCHLSWRNHFVQMVDTPGYADFAADMLGAVRAVDAGILVVDASGGVEVGTERAWDALEELKLPRLIFINKIDKENVNCDQVVKEIQERFSKAAAVISFPISAELKETITETNDELLERYLEGKEIKEEELKKALKDAIAKGKLYPVITGSALTGKGTKELLDFIVDYLPSPVERPAVVATDAQTNEARELKLSEDAPFAAFVFKSVVDPFVGQLTIFRIFAGTLAGNTGFYNVTHSSKERIGQLILLQGKEQRPVASASCGDIVAVAKLKETFLGDSLADEKQQVIFAPVVFPEPVFSSSIKPKTRQDEEKISEALAKLCASDPTFKISRDTQTKETIISGLGDQHIDVMVKRLKERYHVEVEIGTPKVPYKETIKKAAKAQGKHKKQSGGRGQYGDVWLEVAPLERGKDFEFVDKIVGGAIPRNFIPSVEKGVHNAMVGGVITSFPMVGVRATAYDGSYHDVDSSDMAFQIAGALAFRKAAMEAQPILLEPIMEVEITVPEECMGSIPADLNSRRGRVLGVEARGKNQTIKALVPLAEMFRYATDLRSMTGGRGSYTMHFSSYEEVPAKISQGIVAQNPRHKHEEE